MVAIYIHSLPFWRPTGWPSFKHMRNHDLSPLSTRVPIAFVISRLRRSKSVKLAVYNASRYLYLIPLLLRLQIFWTSRIRLDYMYLDTLYPAIFPTRLYQWRLNIFFNSDQKMEACVRQLDGFIMPYLANILGYETSVVGLKPRVAHHSLDLLTYNTLSEFLLYMLIQRCLIDDEHMHASKYLTQYFPNTFPYFPNTSPILLQDVIGKLSVMILEQESGYIGNLRLYRFPFAAKQATNAEEMKRHTRRLTGFSSFLNK